MVMVQTRLMQLQSYAEGGITMVSYAYGGQPVTRLQRFLLLSEAEAFLAPLGVTSGSLLESGDRCCCSHCSCFVCFACLPLSLFFPFSSLRHSRSLVTPFLLHFSSARDLGILIVVVR